MPALSAMASQRRKSMSKMGLRGFSEGALATCELFIVDGLGVMGLVSQGGSEALSVGGLGVVGRVSRCEKEALNVVGLGVMGLVSQGGSEALSVGGLGVVGKVNRCAPGKLCDAWAASTRPSESLLCNVTLESL
jgi:hypothetical protein